MTASEATIDLSQAPYTVPCPMCLAFALEPCRESRRVWVVDGQSMAGGRLRWPEVSPLRLVPHDARQRHWEEHPEFRVTPIR